MLKKAFMLISGNAFGSAFLLARNLIVARLISPEDYGIASTFAISMSIVEMFSNFGLNQMIVVDKDGDDPEVQKALQGFQMLRGIASSLLLFLIAGQFAAFLGIPDLAWAYQVIAFIPLINALQHFDMHRLKRHLRFAPSIQAAALPPLVSVLALWPLALIYDDYRIMLVALFVQAIALVILSHVAAERPYRLKIDFALIRRATVFGWPLLLNGALLFCVFNGERLIVGRELDVAAWAVFNGVYAYTDAHAGSGKFEPVVFPAAAFSCTREQGKVSVPQRGGAGIKSADRCLAGSVCGIVWCAGYRASGRPEVFRRPVLSCSHGGFAGGSRR